MSYTETPEQRQIRILRNSISSMRSDNDRLSSQNRRLEREMELVRRQQQLENERMAVQMRQLQQQERAARTAALQALDAEVKEKERLQSEKIRAMQTGKAFWNGWALLRKSRKKCLWSMETIRSSTALQS